MRKKIIIGDDTTKKGKTLTAHDRKVKQKKNNSNKDSVMNPTSTSVNPKTPVTPSNNTKVVNIKKKGLVLMGRTKERVNITIDIQLVERYKQFCKENRISFSGRVSDLISTDVEFIEWDGLN